jgi:hypothetical protein
MPRPSQNPFPESDELMVVIAYCAVPGFGDGHFAVSGKNEFRQVVSNALNNNDSSAPQGVAFRKLM